MALGTRHTDSAGRPRVWPARVALAAWVAVCACMLVADVSWAAPAVMLATLAVAAGGAVLGALSGARMDARVEMPGRASKGELLDCALAVSNGSAMPVWRAVVPVAVGNPLTGETFRIPLGVALAPRGRVRVPFQVESPHCGVIQAGCEQAWALDLLGIVRRRRALSASSHVAVPPAAMPLGARRSGARAYDIESFTYATDRPGDDPAETFSVREYAPGDSVRRIHWKLTGKMGQTMVRESGFPIFSTLALLVETAWDEGALRPDWADAQMEATSSIMASLLEEAIAFELIFVDRTSGIVVKRRVADEVALWESVGLLLAAPRVEGAPDSVRPALEARADEVWARVVYITAGSTGADAAALSQGGGSVTVLRMSQAPGGLERRDGVDEIRFSPDTWQADLSEVAL